MERVGHPVSALGSIHTEEDNGTVLQADKIAKLVVPVPGALYLLASGWGREDSVVRPRKHPYTKNPELRIDIARSS